MQKLQYISQGSTYEQQKKAVMAALDHGVSWIQLRWKQGSGRELVQLAEYLRKQTHAYKANLIINDHIQLSQAVDADGVHLGLIDDSVGWAREVIGSGKLIGGTANSLSDILQRIEEGCDYIGLGPFRYTRSKEKLSPILGIQGYKTLLEELKTRQLNYPPIFAIGGIVLEDIDELMAAGFFGVAVSKAIYDKPQLIAEFKNKLR